MLKPNCPCLRSKLPCSHILQRLLTRFTQQELADIYSVNEKTIRRNLQPSNLPKQKRGRKRKIDGNNLNFLRDFTIALQAVTQKHLTRLFKCSQSTISLSLKRVGVAYKGFTYQSIEQLRQKNKEKIEEFVNKTLPSLLQSEANIFFLDESSFHLNLAPRKGYELKSSRLVGQKPGNRGKNQTLILLAQFTNGRKIVKGSLIERSVNSKEFHEFLSGFNPPNNGKRNVLIMDNLSVHKATKSCWKQGLTSIEELMVSKNTEIIFLPSYTPELNPIEKVNNILKQYVESFRVREREELKMVLGERLFFFQKEDATKYLESSIKECLMKNEKTHPPQKNLCSRYEGKKPLTSEDGRQINWAVDFEISPSREISAAYLVLENNRLKKKVKQLG